MSNSTPIFRKLWVGIQPRLHKLTTAHAGTISMYLLTAVDHQTGECNVDAEYVAAALRVNVKTVYKAFAAIRDSGIASQTRRGGTSSTWTFPVIDCPADLTHETGQPKKRVDPRNGSTHKTGQPTEQVRVDPQNGSGLTHETGQPLNIDREKREESGGATAQDGSATGATAPVSPLDDWDPYSGEDFPSADPQRPEATGGQPQTSSAHPVGPIPSAPAEPEANAGIPAEPICGVQSGGDDSTHVPAAQQASPSQLGLLAAEPSSPSRRKKGAKLTDADRAAARRDLVTMAGFLGYGMDGVDNTPDKWSDLKPYDRNWFHHLTTLETADVNQLLPEATELQVAAWAWWRLNVLLTTQGLDLMLPGSGSDLMSSGRRPGLLGNLFQMRGLAWCIRHVMTVTENWDQIKDSLSWMRTPPAIGPGLFRVPQIIDASDRITQSQREVA